MAFSMDRWCAAGVSFLTLAALMAPAAAYAQVQFDFDLPAQPLADSLRAVGSRAGVSIAFAPADVKAIEAPALRGAYSAEAAVRHLIAGSGLALRIGSGGGFLISAPSAGRTGVEASTELSEVMVTGTLVRGVIPAAPLIGFDRDDFSRAGYTGLGQLLETLPQNYGGGAPGTINAVGDSQIGGRIGAATIPDLRGLGDATLVLLDGRRLARSGVSSSADISQVPLAAVERVEIVTDGASAIYGSDAIAGVINVITRKRFDGLEASLARSFTSRGGGATTTTSLLGGRSWSTGSLLLSGEYAQQEKLTADDRAFSAAAPPYFSLVPGVKRTSMTGYLRQQLADRLSIYAIGLHSIQSSAYDYGSTTLAARQYVRGAKNQASLGFDIDLPADWTADVGVSLAKDRSKSLLFSYQLPGWEETPFPVLEYSNRETGVEAKFNGTLLRLPAGPTRAAFGFGYARQSFRQEQFELSGESVVAPVGARENWFVYGELHAPLISPDPARLGLTDLYLTFSHRYDRYSDVGETSNPKIGLVFKPLDDIRIAATWGTSFRAPLLTTLKQGAYAYLYPLRDPADPDNVLPALLLIGGRADLRPETSESWTASLTWTPVAAPGLKVTAVYFDYDFTDRIGQPSYETSDALSNPVLAPFVINQPTSAQLSAALGEAIRFTSLMPGLSAEDAVAIFDNRSINLSGWRSRGVDLQASYVLPTSAGDWSLTGNYTNQRITQRTSALAPSVQVAGRVFHPPRQKARVGVNWSHGGWSSSAFVNYVSEAKDLSTPEPATIDDFVTLDLQLSYAFGSGGGGWLRNTRISLTAHNALDADPPSIPPTSGSYPGLGYDSTNASPLGRVMTLHLSRSW